MIREKIAQIILGFVIVLCQLFIILNCLELIHLFGTRVVINNIDNYYKSNIYFIGDIEGQISSCKDCDHIRDPLPKVSTILKAQQDSLFFDIGNSSNSLSSKYREFQPLLEIYGLMGITAINLTKRDVLRMSNDRREYKGIKLIASNIGQRGDSSLGFDKKSGGMLEEKAKVANISQNVSIKFHKKKNNSFKAIKIGIVGLSDNRRVLTGGTTKAVAEDQLEALKKSLPNINAVHAILLYHDSVLNLRRILSDKYINSRIILVLGRFGISDTDRLRYIEGIPVAYVSGGGRYLGHIELYLDKNEFLTSYNEIYLDDYIPPDATIAHIILDNEKAKF